MIQKYIIDKADIHDLLTGKEIPLGQGSKARAFCVEIAGGMTYGEVLKAVFPNITFQKAQDEDSGEKCVIAWTGENILFEFSLDIWDSPYQKDGEEDK